MVTNMSINRENQWWAGKPPVVSSAGQDNIRGPPRSAVTHRGVFLDLIPSIEYLIPYHSSPPNTGIVANHIRLRRMLPSQEVAVLPDRHCLLSQTFLSSEVSLQDSTNSARARRCSLTSNWLDRNGCRVGLGTAYIAILTIGFDEEDA